jgi:hypothetical protein
VPLRRGDAHRHVSLGAGCDGRWPASGDPFTWTKRLLADGEVVWSWRRDPGVNPRRPVVAGVTVTNKGRSPGRARISRKPIARGKPGCPGCTCQTRVRCCHFFAHGAAGAVGARLSLRPLTEEGATRLHNPGENESRECECLCRKFTVVPDKRANGSRECAPDDRLRERDPGSITTGHRFAKAGAPARSNNSTLWLWVPAFAGTTAGHEARARHPISAVASASSP